MSQANGVTVVYDEDWANTQGGRRKLLKRHRSMNGIKSRKREPAVKRAVKISKSTLDMEREHALRTKVDIDNPTERVQAKAAFATEMARLPNKLRAAVKTYEDRYPEEEQEITFPSAAEMAVAEAQHAEMDKDADYEIGSSAWSGPEVTIDTIDK